MSKPKSNTSIAGAAEMAPAFSAAPHLSRRGLTLLLAAMCLVPVVTILWLFWTLPAVYRNELPVEVWLENVPPASYYQTPASRRPSIPTAALVVKNVGDQPWTNINIRVNQHFQIYEHKVPFAPDTQRGFLLDRFVTRTGATFDLRLVRVKHLEIYARLPSGARATYEQHFDD